LIHVLVGRKCLIVTSLVTDSIVIYRALAAVAATGLLLPQWFSRCCPQPGYRSGQDQG
jgi:hypothetical protein